MTLEEKYKLLQQELLTNQSNMYVLSQRQTGLMNQISLCEEIFRDRTKTQPPEPTKKDSSDKKIKEIPIEKKKKKTKHGHKVL